MTLSRRTFLLGAATVLAAPAVVRAESLMRLWVPPKRRIILAEEDIQNGSLDDYEEGYWTPVVNWQERNLHGWVEFERVPPRRYTKIGKTVFLI